MRTGAWGGMPPGGDPAFLIFGSFDQAKERTKKNNYRFDEDFSLRVEMTKKRKMTAKSMLLLSA